MTASAAATATAVSTAEQSSEAVKGKKADRSPNVGRGHNGIDPVLWIYLVQVAAPAALS